MGNHDGGGGDRLSPWQVLAALVAAGKLREVDGEYEVVDEQSWRRLTAVEGDHEERKRAQNRENVRIYRARLRAAGDSSGGYRLLLPEIKERDGEGCAYCGTTRGNLVIDHLLPVSKGGRSVLINLVQACRPCNARKYNLLLHSTNIRIVAPEAARGWARIVEQMDGRDRLEPEDWEAIIAHPSPQTLQGAYIPYRAGPQTLQAVSTGLTGKPTDLTARGLQTLRASTTDAALPHHNGLNGAYTASTTSGAYSVPVEEEEGSIPLDHLPPPGGLGGVWQHQDEVCKTLASIDGFRPHEINPAEVTRLQAEVPAVDLLAVAITYAEADRDGTLTQPPTWGRFKKWAVREARDNAARAPTPAPTRVALRRAADFS
jgi:5-methylcytosine-specific restriction endonuclease McrA